MFDWIDKRLSIREVLTQPSFPRGRASWQYFPGFMAFILFLFQCATGILVSLNFSSTLLNDSGFLYKFHQINTKLLLIFITLQLLRNFLVGSYQAFREIHWIILVTIFILIWVNYFLGFFFNSNIQVDNMIFYEELKSIPFLGNLPDKATSETTKMIFLVHILILPMITYTFFLTYIWLLERTGLESRNKD